MKINFIIALLIFSASSQSMSNFNDAFLEGVNDINAPIYFTQDQFTIEPFQERFDNLCCGWVFQIGVKVMNDFDTCNIPVLNQGAGY